MIEEEIVLMISSLNKTRIIQCRSKLLQNVQLNIKEMGTVKTRVFVSSEGIKKTVYLPPDKIQSDGNSTIIKWHVPDPNGDYEDSMRVNKTFEEVITLIQQASEVNLY